MTPLAWHSRRDLPDAINLRILRWKENPGWFQWTQCHHKGPHMRKAGRSKEQTTEAEIGRRRLVGLPPHHNVNLGDTGHPQPGFLYLGGSPSPGRWRVGEHQGMRAAPWNWEIKKTESPLEPPEETGLPTPWLELPLDSFHTSDLQNYKRIHLWCFESLSLQ